ncbi:type II toxin-antitoxin system RelB/DinJ family antitoxin [Candidatus Saccharibacteria bacterium]|nr:type II toxin-antitoxin system RelB/DinJ family antitoxin [Candidatus Saccharibacteria bacterium]
MYDTAITFRTNSKTKAEAQKVFSELGLDLSTALNIFLAKATRTKSIPFDIAYEDETPNAETLAAIKETYEHPERLEGPYTTKKEIVEALRRA